MKRIAILTGLLLVAWLVLGRLVAGPPAFSPSSAIAADADDAADAAPAKDEKSAKPAKADDAAASDDAAKDDGEAAGEEAPEFPEGYAGDEACEACHEEIAASVKTTPHVEGARTAWVGRTCEGCHGPGAAHVDDPSTENIRTMKDPMPVSERAGACLACHGDDAHLQGVRGGEHTLEGVPCSGCHTPHTKGVGDAMLQKAQPELCMSCHLDVKAAFTMPWVHGPREAKVVCADCHDPHGGKNPGLMKEPNDRTCLSCHAEQQGPWVYEHGGLVTEGCQSCHVPHGAANRQLLRFQQPATLCYQCHTLTPSSHAQPNYRDCTRCHVWVHGSNTDPHFLEP